MVDGAVTVFQGKRVSNLMEKISRSDEEISELETKLDMERYS